MTEDSEDFLVEFLVGGWPTPLKNMTSSVGVTIPNIYGKIKNGPHHQPDLDLPGELMKGLKL